MERTSRIRLLGPARVLGGGGDVAARLSGRVQQLLLAALALRPGRPAPVPDLVASIWGERPPDSVHNALQVHVSGLRRVLEPLDMSIRRDNATYTLVCDISDVDAAMFEALVASAQSLLRNAEPEAALQTIERALALATGPFLAGLELPSTLRQARHAIAERLMAARRDHIIALYRSGRPDEAVERATSLVADDPLDEASWSRLMSAQYHAGHTHAALETFQEARRILREELGVEPSPHLTALQHDILNHRLPTPGHLTTGHHRSAQVEQQLFGRDALIDEVAQAVASHRLVTLHGLGGVGKSALCLAAIAKLGANPHRVTASEMRAGLPPFDALFVVDDIDDVDGFDALIRDALRRVPRATFVVTARHPLGLESEFAVAVPPLPGADDGTSAAEKLFVHHAARIRPDLDLSDAGADIAELCRLSGGLPLAIELLAARIKVSTPARLVEQIHSSPEVLAALTADPEPRRSMPTIVEWTVASCSAAAQHLLFTMSECTGPISGRLVDAMSQSPNALAELVGAGLVSGPSRSDHFVVLPPVAQLLGAPPPEACETLLDAVIDLVRPPDGGRPSLSSLADDEPAVMRAVELSCDGGHPGLLLPWLTRFWLATQSVTRGIDVLTSALPDAAADEAVALQIAREALRALTGESDPDIYEESLRAAQGTPWQESRLVVDGWCSLARIHASQFRAHKVAQCADEAASAAGQDPVLGALAKSCRALAVDLAGDPAAGVALGFQSVATLRQFSDAQDVALTLTQLVQPLLQLGHVIQAKDAVDEMLELSARHPMGATAVLIAAEASLVELAEGQPAAAMGLATTVLRKLDETGCHAPQEIVALKCLAIAHQQLGNTEIAATFLGAAEEKSRRIGGRHEAPPSETVSATRAALDKAPEFTQHHLIGTTDPDGAILRWLAVVAKA